MTLVRSMDEWTDFPPSMRSHLFHERGVRLVPGPAAPVVMLVLVPPAPVARGGQQDVVDVLDDELDGNWNERGKKRNGERSH